MARPKIPPGTQTELFVQSRRRCSLCFGLDGDSTRKKGQIAHLNQEANDNRLENLVFLCLEHHDEYDSRTSQSKGLTSDEVRHFRQALYEYVERELALSAASSTPKDASEVPMGATHPLMTEGDALTLLKAAQAKQDVVTEIAAGYGETLGEFSAGMRKWTAKAPEIAQKKAMRQAKAHLNSVGAELTSFAGRLDSQRRQFTLAASDMFTAFTTAMVVASDLDFVSRPLFEEKARSLTSLHTQVQALKTGATGAREAIQGWSRTTTGFNRGRRLVIGTLSGFADDLDRLSEALQENHAVLCETMELL